MFMEGKVNRKSKERLLRQAQRAALGALVPPLVRLGLGFGFLYSGEPGDLGWRVDELAELVGHASYVYHLVNGLGPLAYFLAPACMKCGWGQYKRSLIQP